MSLNESPQPQTGDVTPLQIIAGALMAGVIVFGMVALLLASDGEPSAGFVALIGVALAVICGFLSLTVPEMIVKKQRGQLPSLQSDEPEESRLRADLQNLYRMRLITGLALAEGAAFFNLIAYIIDIRWWSLAFAVVLLAIMAAKFPTQDRLHQWMQLQKEQIRQ